jgi:hypothetical protein
VPDASANWLFSRLGTHCLENFFGLIRRNSFGDNRLVRAVRIIARGISVADVMHELRLSVTHRNHQNKGRVFISGSSPTFADEYADRVFRSLVRLASLEHRAVNPQNLLSRSQIQGQVQKWHEPDQHHEQNEAYNTKFVGKTSGSRIAARYIDRFVTAESQGE